VIACLERAGFVNAARSGSALGGGADRATGSELLVHGPYRTPAEADASVQSLTGADSAVRGGLYVVSAKLTSHLSARVRKVAMCLSGPAGGSSGSQTF
jgi:hypothetical protein